jgi:hypothetical protein
VLQLVDDCIVVCGVARLNGQQHLDFSEPRSRAGAMVIDV